MWGEEACKIYTFKIQVKGSEGDLLQCGLNEFCFINQIFLVMPSYSEKNGWIFKNKDATKIYDFTDRKMIKKKTDNKGLQTRFFRACTKDPFIQ